MSSIIDEAVKVAYRSTHKKHMTGCVIVDLKGKGEVVANGWSHIGNWHITRLYSIHAEIHALIRARKKKEILDGCIAVVATIARKSGSVRNGLPCLSCATALVAAGIDTAIYTVPADDYFLTEGINGVDNTTSIPRTWFTEEVYLPEAIESSNLKVYNKR